MSIRTASAAALALAVGLALAGCVGDPAPPSIITPDETLPPAVPFDGELVGEGTVLQLGEAAPQFCLGPVMESYPPQCSGPELIGWDWDAVQGHETVNDVTWGSYAVWGTWDGTRFTVGSAVMLALYDPMGVEDPFLAPANAGTTPEAELVRIQDELGRSAPFLPLASWPENGYLFVQVVLDDGSIQDWVDERYGADVVQIRPALRPVST